MKTWERHVNFSADCWYNDCKRNSQAVSKPIVEGDDTMMQRKREIAGVEDVQGNGENDLRYDFHSLGHCQVLIHESITLFQELTRSGMSIPDFPLNIQLIMPKSIANTAIICYANNITNINDLSLTKVLCISLTAHENTFGPASQFFGFPCDLESKRRQRLCKLFCRGLTIMLHRFMHQPFQLFLRFDQRFECRECFVDEDSLEIALCFHSSFNCSQDDINGI